MRPLSSRESSTQSSRRRPPLTKPYLSITSKQDFETPRTGWHLEETAPRRDGRVVALVKVLPYAWSGQMPARRTRTQTDGRILAMEVERRIKQLVGRQLVLELPETFENHRVEYRRRDSKRAPAAPGDCR